jgi:hypothetical protein
MSALSAQITEILNALIQACKTLMQKVGAEKPIFIAAGKDVEGHVVDLVEVVKDAGDQVMMDKALDIKKCCEWMIRECVIMKNNPSGKSLEERQALSQKIISQLKITFQNLSVATKNFLKRSQAAMASEEMEQSIPSKRPDSDSDDEANALNKKRNSQADEPNYQSHSNPRANTPSFVTRTKYERENSDGGGEGGYNSNPNERAFKPSLHRSNTNTLVRSDGGGSGDYSNVPFNVNPKSNNYATVNNSPPSAYDPCMDDASDPEANDGDPNWRGNRERTLSPRTRDTQQMLANRALMPNRPSRAVSQQTPITPPTGRQLSTRQLTGPERSDLTRSGTFFILFFSFPIEFASHL